MIMADQKGDRMKKYYLIACYDYLDCINTMQEMYLNIKVNSFMKKIFTQKKHILAIESDDAVVLFRPIMALENMRGASFFGIGKSLKYKSFGGFEEKEILNQIYQRSIREFGILDRDRVISEYLRT